MKPKLLISLALALLLMPAAAAFADANGGPFVMATHSFGGSDPHVYGPLREQYAASANTEVQVLLARSGYYTGPIDGNVALGSKTSLAIARYQLTHRLPVTGAIDGNLLASLNGQNGQ